MKTPLLLLHGALGSKVQLEALSRQFPADLPVHALDFPGHGGSPADADFSIPRFADAVLGYMNSAGLREVDIFGYSMGGYTALHLAWQHPDRVRRIVTLGTKFDWTPETAARESAMLDAEKIEAKVPHFAEALAQRHAPADWKLVLRQTAALLHGLGNGQALTPAAFAQIQCPVAILRGELDNMVTAEESEKAAATLPAGRYELLPGGKHPIEQVDPGQLAARIMAHLYPAE